MISMKQTSFPTERPKISIFPSNVELLYDLHNKYPNGVDVNLIDDEYIVSKEIQLPSFTSISGHGSKKTRIIQEKYTNAHLFKNSDFNRGNRSIHFSGFSVEGNGDFQDRPEGHTALTFCCAIYLKRVAETSVVDCAFHDIRQTASHFSDCSGVIVKAHSAEKLGWSGVSTSGTDNMWAQTHVSDAGRDVMHSAVHIDGGVGVYVEADVSNTTGNGIMLDSAYRALINSAVKGRVVTCRRGVSLSGSAVNELRNVFIEGEFCDNREVGVMVSNARSVAIANSLIQRNGEVGLRLQGRNGGRETLIVNCDVSNNYVDYEHLHASEDNWIFAAPEVLSADGWRKFNSRMLSRQKK